MAASYPSSIKSFSAKANGDVIAVTHITDLEAEVAAIETALVTGPITLNSVAVTGAATLSSTVATGALTVTGAATVSTTLGVTGATTLSSTVATGALTVTGNETVSGTLGVTGATTLSSTLGVTGVTTVTAGNAAAPSVVSVTGTSDTGVFFPAADTVAYSTAGTERLRINSSGYVGIGTNSQTNVLEVKADTSRFYCVTNPTTSLTAKQISIGESSNNPAYRLQVGYFTDGSYKGSIQSLDNSTGSSLAINAAGGNVGIGTSSPTQRLTVADVIQCAVDGQNGFLYFGGSYERIAANYASHCFLLYTNNTERIRIASDGNVGIGTTGPVAKLDVAGPNGAVAVNILCGNGPALPTIINVNGNSALAMSANRSGGQSELNLINTNYGALGTGGIWFEQATGAAAVATRMVIDKNGNVGIGTTAPAYQLNLTTDSAGKPGVGGLWTVISDERIKADIVPADLDRCYEIVKSVPLKHFGFAPGVYTDEQIQDKHSLGWIAQDVQQVFAKAVSVKPFTLHTDIPDGTEDYEEQAFTLDQVETTTTSIQIIDGKPVQVSTTETAENKVLLFDTVDVLDESGAVVMDGDMPLTYQMPRMVTKTRPKVRHETIEDCLDLNSGQMIAALYGCVQALMAKVEALEAK